MKIEIIPKKLKGNINVIASKSCLHRAIIAASLADGVSVIDNVLYSKDVIATIEGCIKLGANIERLESRLIIKGTLNINNNQVIDCNESGSTLRFLIPIFLTKELNTKFIGKESLFNRPLNLYLDIFKRNNISFELSNELNVNGVLQEKEYNIEGNVSSQFISGLLFALPLLKHDTIINVSNLESRGYVSMTLDILKQFGIDITNNNYNQFIIKGSQQYKCCRYIAEADYSQASFFIVANELGNDIEISNLNSNSLQPDKKILEDIKNIKKNIPIDLSQNPDCGPILSVLAIFYDAMFINSKRLRIKESDRIDSMQSILNKLGANISSTEDTMNFIKVDKIDGNIEINCFNDHRVCMAIAIASTVCNNNIVIVDSECVSKSYPNFWDDFKKIGGIFNVK